MDDDVSHPLTNGRDTPNGTGLTSGPGLVNGLGYTSQAERPRRDPVGLHHLPVTMCEERCQGCSGMRVTRDLINGFAIEPSEGPRDPKIGPGPFGRKARARHRRLAEMAQGPLPGEDR